MHVWPPHSSTPSRRTAACSLRLSPALCRPFLLGSSILSVVAFAHAGRSSPTFDTHTIADPTPCDAVTFSWTGGIPPFSLYLGDPDTVSILSHIDDIAERFVAWTPPQDTVGMTLIATVFDDDDDNDTTNEFVVQPAACLSASPPAAPASSFSVSAEPSTSGSPRNPYSILPTTQSPTAPSGTPSPSLSTSTRTAASAPPSLSSSSSPQSSSSGSESTPPTGTGNSTVTSHPTTGIPSATSTETSRLPLGTNSTPHWRFTQRPRRKPPSPSSPSTGEIAGIVLGSVALLCVLFGILIWRRVAVARRAMHSKGGQAAEYRDDGSSASVLVPQRQSSHSMVVPQASPVSTKVAAAAAGNRHRYSVAAAGSPSTPVVGAVPAPPPDPPNAADDVLHIRAVHDDAEANSIAVEQPTSHLRDTLLLRPGHGSSLIGAPPGLPGPARASLNKVESLSLPLCPGDASATEALTAGAGAGAGTGTRRVSVSAEPKPEPALDAEQGRTEGEVEAIPNGGARTRRITLLESDGGIRLAGGPPPGDVNVVVAGEGGDVERSGEPSRLIGSDGLVEIETLPPPYHRYNT